MKTEVDQRWWESQFKFANGASVASVINGRPYVDTTAMSVRAVISTATEDRVGDILDSRGCQLKNYAKNPCVLWGHGLEGLVLPIGTSNDPDGNLAIDIGDDEVIGTCFFSQKNQEAQQIFDLIVEGIVRATSVRETPLKSRSARIEGRTVQLVDEWDLEEWSFCAIGVNPDAVAKAMTRRIDGRKLSPSIMKSLNAVLPAKRVFGVGSDMKTDKDPDGDGDDDTKPATDTDHDGGTGVQDLAQQPYGAQLIAAYHGALSAANKKAESGMGAMEHPEATPAMRTALDAVKDVMGALRGAHAGCYPKSTLKDDGADDMGDDTDESEMKAWLAKGCNSLTLKGAVLQLKSLTAATNLTPSQRQLVNDLANGFTRWDSQAKSLRAKQQEANKPSPPAEQEWTPEQKAEAEALLARMKS